MKLGYNTRKQKIKIDLNNFSDEQKLELMIEQQRQKQIALNGSQSLRNVQFMMANIYEERQKNVIKYLTHSTKSTSKKNNDIFSNTQYNNSTKIQTPNIRNSKFRQFDFQEQQLVFSPLIEEEFEYLKVIEKKKQHYEKILKQSDCNTNINRLSAFFNPQPIKFQFPSKKQFTSITNTNEKSGFFQNPLCRKKLDRQQSIAQRFKQKHGSLSIPLSPKHGSIVDNENQIILTQPIIQNQQLKLIDTVEKLNKYQSDKKNYGNILRKKLGIFTEQQKRLFRIQEIQARALKMNLKLKEEDIYKFDETQLVQKAPHIKTKSKNINISSHKSQNRRIKTEEKLNPSPKAQNSQKGHSPIQRKTSTHILQDKFIIIPQTQQTKQKILGFCENLFYHQKNQSQIRKQDSDQVINTMSIIQNELITWQNNLLDKNDQLDRDIFDSIKDQVINYQKEHQDKLVKFN